MLFLLSIFTSISVTNIGCTETANDLLREEILAAHNTYRAEQGIPALKWSEPLADHATMPGRCLLTFEYILIDGVNSSRADAEKLARLLKEQRCKLNLIVFNEYPGSPFKAPSAKDVSAFQQILLDRHFTAMLRKSKGADILAACGQLSGAVEGGLIF